MPGRRTLLVALGVGVAVLLIAAPSSAQEDGSSEAPDVSAGFLYFGTEQVGTFPLPQCPPFGQANPIFNLGAPVPRDGDSEQVPAEAKSGHSSCPAIFTYQAETGFTIRPGTEVTFWFGCEEPRPMYSRNEVGAAEDDYEVFLFHDEEEVAQYQGTYHFALDAVSVCGSNTSVYGRNLFRLEAPLDPPETTIATGDNLTVVINLFGMLADREDIYFAVQSTETPSAIYGPGFPGLQRDSLRSDLLVDAGNRTGNTGPGNATTYAFTVENIGNESREVSLSADGPEAWIAEPSPSELEVPAGETVEANLTVAAPGSLPNGAEARHLVTVASGEETVTFDKMTTVVPGQGEAAPELLGVSSAEESGSAVGELIDEFSVELVATAVVGVGAFVGKQLIF